MDILYYLIAACEINRGTEFFARSKKMAILQCLYQSPGVDTASIKDVLFIKGRNPGLTGDCRLCGSEGTVFPWPPLSCSVYWPDFS